MKGLREQAFFISERFRMHACWIKALVMRIVAGAILGAINIDMGRCGQQSLAGIRTPVAVYDA